MWVLYKVVWRLQVHGESNIPPKGAVIIAPNHRSYHDPPLVGASAHRPVHFLAKRSLFRKQPFGWLIANLNAHPTSRAGGAEAIKKAERLLNDGDVIIVFPEGRRAPSDELGPPKGGVGRLSIKTKTPVVPTYVHNSHRMAQFPKVHVSFGKPIHPEKFDSYQELAEEVMAQIGHLKRGFR
jgi:1-acyl-sn-glycerol-3-phosphate acyltransferase